MTQLIGKIIYRTLKITCSCLMLSCTFITLSQASEICQLFDNEGKVTPIGKKQAKKAARMLGFEVVLDADLKKLLILVKSLSEPVEVNTVLDMFNIPHPINNKNPQKEMLKFKEYLREEERKEIDKFKEIFIPHDINSREWPNWLSDIVFQFLTLSEKRVMMRSNEYLAKGVIASIRIKGYRTIKFNTISISRDSELDLKSQVMEFYKEPPQANKKCYRIPREVFLTHLEYRFTGAREQGARESRVRLYGNFLHFYDSNQFIDKISHIKLFLEKELPEEKDLNTLLQALLKGTAITNLVLEVYYENMPELNIDILHSTSLKEFEFYYTELSDVDRVEQPELVLSEEAALAALISKLKTEGFRNRFPKIETIKLNNTTINYPPLEVDNVPSPRFYSERLNMSIGGE